MPTRTDIGKRVRAKSLAKLNADKQQHPEKYEHEMSEKSTYLGLDWDFKHGSLNPGKKKLYEELKLKYEVKK